jgi:hypothetical protein
MKQHMSDHLAAFEAVDDDQLAGEVRPTAMQKLRIVTMDESQTFAAYVYM